MAKSSTTLVTVPANYISHAHTAFASCAFFFALVVGCYTHYYKIVQNEFYGYPDEWFPSVSAATGDRYPARAIFQIFIALTSGPRFILVYLWYLYTTRAAQSTSPSVGRFLLFVGLLRTFSCGGWVYITSTDDHFVHDVAMVVYLVCTLPWQVGCLLTTPKNTPSRRWRKRVILAFFGTLPPMIYYFLQHKIHRVPGAYTTYAFFEWSLIIYDVAFDAITASEFGHFDVTVIDPTGKSMRQSKPGLSVSSERSDNDSQLTVFGLRSIGGFISEVYLAFVFWSMLTALALLIWYFPLWYMGISGYEAYLFVTLAPVLLGINRLRRVIARFAGLFHLVSLVGLTAYIKQDPVWRLSLAAIGIAISLTTWLATWIELKEENGRLERSILVWTLGLVMHTVVKMAWWTENPIWPIMHAENGGYNFEGIILGAVASVVMMLTSQHHASPRIPRSTKSAPQGQWWAAALGFGSLLFALHSMYTDSSTIIRWSGAGYPDPGPSPVPWGSVTTTAMVIGLLWSVHRRWVTSLGWYVVGCASCVCFYMLRGWNAYTGGWVLGVYLLSVTPVLVGAVVVHGPFKTLLAAFMCYNILCLAHVWVVAYEFVPGGVYARERTNWVLATVMLLLGLGVRNARQRGRFKMTQLYIIQKTRTQVRVAVLVLLLASAGVSYHRLQNTVHPEPYRRSQRSFTAAIWTIHFALDDDMWASEIRMRDVIRDLELDVVGLLESDTQRIIMGNRDWAQFIAEDLGYYIDYGPPTMDHTWGCLMLSKFPILHSSHHLLPSPVGELACAIHATLDVYGQPVDFIVSHNGQEENPEDRRQQTTELARIMRTSPNPFVFLGYVVTLPKDPLYHLLFDQGDMNDIDDSDWDRWCEYIGYRGLRRIGYARVSHGKITDTEIQTGKFQVVSDPRAYWKASYEQMDESQVETALRYPAMFRGQGTRGHRYHVFDEPRYYVH